jgi:hypothetical protein
MAAPEKSGKENLTKNGKWHGWGGNGEEDSKGEGGMRDEGRGKRAERRLRPAKRETLGRGRGNRKC